MNYFEISNQSLFWRNRGETLMISPWGPDSLRVRSVLMGEIRDDRWALLDPADCTAEIHAEEESASITVGKITARVTAPGR